MDIKEIEIYLKHPDQCPAQRKYTLSVAGYYYYYSLRYANINISSATNLSAVTMRIQILADSLCHAPPFYI